MLEDLALFDLDNGRGSEEEGDYDDPKKHEPLNLRIKTILGFSSAFLFSTALPVKFFPWRRVHRDHKANKKCAKGLQAIYFQS